MNRRMVLSLWGRIAIATAVLLLLPAVVSLIYGEYAVLQSFVAVALGSGFIGFVLSWIAKPRTTVIYAKDGFIVVAAAWLYISLVGALPFVLSGGIPDYVDAFFETVSGFTTTGASILVNVESLTSKGLLFWRSFTHWVGGMGVLVFIMAFLSNTGERTIHILRAEMPGHEVGKLVPRSRDTAKILYLIYSGLTVVEILLLWCGDMDLFESIIHALGAAGTGGFGIRADSLASFSPYSQWVLTVFMLIFGVNFNLYYMILLGRFSAFWKSTEFKAYLGIALTAIAGITCNILSLSRSFGEALRLAAFQVSSILTTTGYSTTDFNTWPALSKAILLCLMFIGGCSGSTAGGMKVSRVVLLFRMAGREFKRLLHPRSVNSVRFEGKAVEESTLHSVSLYAGLYLICFAAVFLLLSLENNSMETNFSATAACFNNVGPGFGAVGPAASYAAYSAFSKLVLSFAMLMGRLEIFPILLFFVPATWRKR